MNALISIDLAVSFGSDVAPGTRRNAGGCS